MIDNSAVQKVPFPARALDEFQISVVVSNVIYSSLLHFERILYEMCNIAFQVPMASTYGGLCAANDSVSKCGDNDNETMEINVNDNKATFAAEEAVSPKSQIADSEKCENDRNLSTKETHAGKALCEKENGTSSNANGATPNCENTENNTNDVKEDKKNLI